MQSSVATAVSHSESQDLFEALMAVCPDAVFVVDAGGRIERANSAAKRLLGAPMEELRGRLLVEWVEPGSERERIVASLGSTGAHRVERVQARFERHPRRLDVRIGPAGKNSSARVVLLRDESEFARVRHQLTGSHHLEAIGRLSSGIAHEINTPIQFVGNSATFLETAVNDMSRIIAAYRELVSEASIGPVHPAAIREVRQLEEELDLGYLAERIPEAIARINHGVARVAEIAHAMRTFAHRERTPMQASDLNRVLDGALLVARSSVGRVARLTTDLERLPMVVCHASEIGQVFLNLLVNAADAVADSGRSPTEGAIAVRARALGDFVEVVITDNGPGIAESIRPRIFEPFFTTKGAGEGTGQGLSIAREIVEETHGGRLSFESSPEVGTSFSVVLPIDARNRGR